MAGAIEIPSAIVLRGVARPGLLLMAAPNLTKLSGGVALLVALFTLNPILGMWAFFPAHLVAIWLTYRDRYIVEVLRARMRCRPTRNLGGRPGHRYVP
jgi:Type IV secretory pathway, VirB3-like protein